MNRIPLLSERKKKTNRLVNRLKDPKKTKDEASDRIKAESVTFYGRYFKICKRIDEKEMIHETTKS